MDSVPSARTPAETPATDPIAKLELAFIDEFLQEHGLTLAGLHELPPDEVRATMLDALRDAAGRLAEVEARSRYIHELHQGPRS